MGIFRGDRCSAGRNLLVALLAYVIAATGLLGAINRSASAFDAAQAGPMIICSLDGLSVVPGGDPDGAKVLHLHQHCALCGVAMPTTVALAEIVATDVAEPVAQRTPFVFYAPVLPAYSFIGWDGTRPPRAPPVAA